jgi:hypothetical protein
MVDIRRKPHKNIIKNIENNIGGSCGELAQAYRDIFDKRGIFKLLQKDTKNDDMFIETIC